jgi:hypothetical protein
MNTDGVPDQGNLFNHDYFCLGFQKPLPLSLNASALGERMTKRRYLLGCVFGCFLLALPGLMAQTLQVVNGEGHSATITAAQIAALPHVTVNVRDHDKDARFEGVPLATVLSMTGIQLGESLRGPRMTEMLLVEAGDGYKVVFALAEIDPAFATKEIILADKRDGKPLDAKEGPLRIVAPGEKRPARWVRQVIALKLIAAN